MKWYVLMGISLLMLSLSIVMLSIHNNGFLAVCWIICIIIDIGGILTSLHSIVNNEE